MYRCSSLNLCTTLVCTISPDSLFLGSVPAYTWVKMNVKLQKKFKEN